MKRKNELVEENGRAGIHPFPLSDIIEATKEGIPSDVFEQVEFQHHNDFGLFMENSNSSITPEIGEPYPGEIITMKNNFWVVQEEVQNTDREAQVGLIEPLQPPVRLVYREWPRNLLRLANLLTQAKLGKRLIWNMQKHGKKIKVFRTVSRAEAYLVTSLILMGWSYKQIKSLFDDIKSPHYLEAGENYLVTTYNNALNNLSNDEMRRKIANAYPFVSIIPWPGRTGATDMKVLKAILANGWQAKSWLLKMSLRDISEHATVSISTARRAIWRLDDVGLLHIPDGGVKWETQEFDINMILLVSEQYISHFLPSNVVSIDTSPAIGELWSTGGLGPTCALIYAHLSSTDAKSVLELQKATGKSKNTVKNNLDRLLKWGLAITTDDGQWLRGDVDLEEVARRLDTEKRAMKRRRKHKRERDAYAEQQKKWAEQTGPKR